MKRRQVITGLLAVGAMGVLPHTGHRSMRSGEQPVNLYSSSVDIDPPSFDPLSDHENRSVLVPPSAASTFSPPAQKTIEPVSIPAPTSQFTEVSESSVGPFVEDDNTLSKDAMAHTVDVQSQHVSVHPTPEQQRHINKAIYFEQDYLDDIFVTLKDTPLLHSVHLRLKKLQSQVGYGHFNILNFDDALTFAKRYSAVGQFTPAELMFIDDVFSRNAADYGFYGEKVITSLTTNINKSNTFKVPHTGHYLFKEQSIQYYEKLREHIGEGIVLTSGIRSNVKQLHLFLAKVVRVNGNLSRASRSLAPPGYSYHGIGDFDVGRKGWGGKNFTDAFSKTDEFKRMQDLGYVTIRYDEGNTLGVRFEPWHIKVV